MGFRLLGLWLPLSLCLVLGGCATSDLTGTKHTIIFRPDGAPNSRLQGTYSLIRASDLNSHVFRGRALSQAVADPKNGTLRFTLPTADTIQVSPPICLAIVGPHGQVPVCNNHSEPHTFRNPLWEEDLARVQSRKQVSQNVGSLRAEATSMRARLDVVFNELQGYGVRSLDECKVGPPVPLPPRPVTAVGPENRPIVAAQACAVAWEGPLKEMAGKLYAATKRPDAWNQRVQAADVQRALNIHMTPDSSEIAGWELTLAQGERFLQHDEFLSLFDTRTAECEKAAIQRIIEHTKQWETKVAEAGATPQRLLKQCQAIGENHKQLSLDLRNAESKLAHAEEELNRLRESSSNGMESKSLVAYTCTDR